MAADRAMLPPCHPAEHFWDDLEEMLGDAMLEDFNTEAEDGSPAEVRC